jgi:hypothetical protein
MKHSAEGFRFLEFLLARRILIHGRHNKQPPSVSISESFENSKKQFDPILASRPSRIYGNNIELRSHLLCQVSSLRLYPSAATRRGAGVVRLELFRLIAQLQA